MAFVLPPNWWQDPQIPLYNSEYVEGTRLREELRQARFVGLFFGSYQSRASRVLANALKNLFTHVKGKDEKFQIIFISTDENERDAQDFSKEQGDWLILPWQLQQPRRNIRYHYSALNPPSFVVCKNNLEGTIVSLEAKDDVQELGVDSYDKWKALSL